MRILFLMMAAALLWACGEKVQPAEEHFANAENYAKWVDEKVGGKLAWRSNSSFAKGDTKMAAWVGYEGGKPLVVRLLNQTGNEEDWHIYLDTATGKALFFKEKILQEGRRVTNRFSYRGDSVAMGMGGNDAYVSANKDLDFRIKPTEVEALAAEVITFVEADIPILSAEANEARRENAQFYATGGKNSWSLIINPSLSKVILRQPGAEERTFGYDVPVTGPKNESIYTFNSLKGKIEVSIFSKGCGVNDGKYYPYTVVVLDASKSFAGCGVLLQ